MFVITTCVTLLSRSTTLLLESLLGCTIPVCWFLQYVQGVALDQGRTDQAVHGYPPAKVQTEYAAKCVPAAENALLEAAVPFDVPLVQEFYTAFGKVLYRSSDHCMTPHGVLLFF